MGDLGVLEGMSRGLFALLVFLKREYIGLGWVGELEGLPGELEAMCF